HGEVALALENGFVEVLSDEQWSRVAVPGFSATGSAVFTGPSEGWLAGPTGLGHWTTEPRPAALVTWPQANRSPLTSVALPPTSDGGLDSSGALAVGLDGTALHFDAATGWMVDAVPAREAHINLHAVAFSSSTTAVAVGQFGSIIRWDGEAWT